MGYRDEWVPRPLDRLKHPSLNEYLEACATLVRDLANSDEDHGPFQSRATRLIANDPRQPKHG